VDISFCLVKKWSNLHVHRVENLFFGVVNDVELLEDLINVLNAVLRGPKDI
jgi:hypothetical protein